VIGDDGEAIGGAVVSITITNVNDNSPVIDDAAGSLSEDAAT
jgi:hypothetical protein